MSAAVESGDMDSDDEPLFAKKNQRPQQVLEKVEIPVNGRWSLASSLSSNLDQLSEYDTPDTSMIETPAESVVKGERSVKPPSTTSNNRSCYRSNESFKGKRKRLEVDELMAADAILAQKIQEQKYGEDQGAASASRPTRDVLIDDSGMSLLSELSEELSPKPESPPKFHKSTPRRFSRRQPKAFPSQTAPTDAGGGWSQDESLDEDETSKVPMPKNKRMKKDSSTALPSRAARASANKIIKDSSFRRILDSEDSNLSEISDDVSLFGSDVVSDASVDSEDTDEEAGDLIGSSNSLTTAVAAASNVSSGSNAIPATGRRGTRRRNASSTQATNPTRGRRSWQRRVEDRVSSKTLLNQSPHLKHTLGCKGTAEARESAP